MTNTGARSRTLPFVFPNDTIETQSEPCSPISTDKSAFKDSCSTSILSPFDPVTSRTGSLPKSSQNVKSSTRNWLSRLPMSGGKKKKNKNKSKTGQSDSLGVPCSGSFVVMNRFAGGNGRRPDSVMDEEINLRTLNRRDRNSVVIRKSLALDEHGCPSSGADVQLRCSSAEPRIGSESPGMREPGKGHKFVVEADKQRALWCDICGDCIISLMYQAIRCINCGYLCHESCRPGVGLDCPSEFEREELSGHESNAQNWDSSTNTSQESIGVHSEKSSVSEHMETVSSSATIKSASTSEHVCEGGAAWNHADASPESPNEYYTVKDGTAFLKYGYGRNHGSKCDKNDGLDADVDAAFSTAENPKHDTDTPPEKQVQKWARRMHRSNTLYSRNSTLFSGGSLLAEEDRATLVGSAAGPKFVTEEMSLLEASTTLPAKLKNKDLEKRVAEYAKLNPHSDLKIVKKSSSFGAKELSKSRESIFSSSKKKDQLEFEGFLYVTMCLHRPISVANEVALDFSLESVYKNMSFERSKSENRTTFYLPYGSEHAVRCLSSDSTLTVVRKLLEKFHVADDPRKYVLFHDQTSPDASVIRRKIKDDEKPLFLALLRDQKTKHNFVLEENEQPDIQWDCFSEHELEMFLEILRVEEEQHIAVIKERYEKERQKLQERLQLLTRYIEATADDPEDALTPEIGLDESMPSFDDICATEEEATGERKSSTSSA